MSLTPKLDKIHPKPKQDINEPNWYDENAPIYNICFALPDASQAFFSYASMVSAICLPEGDHILLTFTMHKVTIKGYNLKALFKYLYARKVYIVMVDDDHRTVSEESTKAIVTDIKVEEI